MADIPTGIMMDATYKGKDVTIYSTTGQKRTEGDFAGAMAEYDRTGNIPKGYTVLEPGVMNTLRGVFEGVNQPLQNAAERVDLGLGRADNPNMTPVQQLLARRTMGNPEGLPQGNVDNAGLTRSITGTVDTPEKAGTTAGMLAVAPLLGPVSVARGAGQVALSKAGLLGNVVKSGVAAGTGSMLMDAALGGTEPFDPAKAIAPIVIGAASGGVQGVIGHMMNKYIKPDMHEQVAKNILKPIADRYSNYKTDPALFDAAASSPEKIADITTAMAKGMRGSLDSTTHDLTQQILQVSPVRLTVGEQATLRAHVRNVNKVANGILDKVSTDKPLDQTLPDLQEPLVNMGKYLYDTLKQKGVKQFTKVDANMAAVLDQFKQNLTTFEEGAYVLNAFRQSGQQNGFDVMAMRDILLGKTTSGQTDMMGKVAKELGMGQPLTRTVNEPSATGVIDRVIGQHLRRIPGIGKYLAPTPAAPVPRLPWQLQQGAAPRTIGIGVQASGQDAINSFMNRKSK